MMFLCLVALGLDLALKSVDGLASLPGDVIYHICLKLSYSEMVKLGQTSKTLHYQIRQQSHLLALKRMESPTFDPWHNEKDRNFARNFPEKYEKYLAGQVTSEMRLMSAAKNGFLELVMHALKCGSDVDPRNQYYERTSLRPRNALQCACENGHVEVVKSLLAWVGPGGERINPKFDNSWDRTGRDRAIVLASTYGHAEIVKVLLEWTGLDASWIDPRVFDNQIIAQASKNGHLRIVQMLLCWRRVTHTGKMAFVDPRSRQNFALIGAVRNGHAAIVELLLAWRGPNWEWVNPNTRFNGTFILLQACEKGRARIIEILLRWKAPSGESIDPTVHDNAAFRKAIDLMRKNPYKALLCIKVLLNWTSYDDIDDDDDDDGIVFVDPRVGDNYAIRKARKAGHTDIVKVLLDWRGPYGESVEKSVILK